MPTFAFITDESSADAFWWKPGITTLNAPGANTGGVGEGDYIEIANLQPSIGTAGTLNTNGIAAAVAHDDDGVAAVAVAVAGGDDDAADHDDATATAANDDAGTTGVLMWQM